MHMITITLIYFGTSGILALWSLFPRSARLLYHSLLKIAFFTSFQNVISFTMMAAVLTNLENLDLRLLKRPEILLLFQKFPLWFLAR